MLKLLAMCTAAGGRAFKKEIKENNDCNCHEFVLYVSTCMCACVCVYVEKRHVLTREYQKQSEGCERISTLINVYRGTSANIRREANERQ